MNRKKTIFGFEDGGILHGSPWPHAKNVSKNSPTHISSRVRHPTTVVLIIWPRNCHNPVEQWLHVRCSYRFIATGPIPIPFELHHLFFSRLFRSTWPLFHRPTTTPPPLPITNQLLSQILDSASCGNSWQANPQIISNKSSEFRYVPAIWKLPALASTGVIGPQDTRTKNLNTGIKSLYGKLSVHLSAHTKF